MKKRLVHSVLGHRVYVLVRYHVIDEAKGLIIASQKEDVTEDFLRVMADWKREERRRKRKPAFLIDPEPETADGT